MLKNQIIAAGIFAALNMILEAQTPPPAASENAPPAEITEGTALPVAYRGLSLGMGLDELKAGLLNDTYFAFRGDRDVSFLPMTEQNLVESEGTHFIKRAFFQLKDAKVFIMAFTMNTELIDHYSIFSVFAEKYGQPQILNPKEAVWESETTRIAIERPLTVKYIDKQVFNALVDESKAVHSRASEMREEFLNDF